MLKVGFSGVLIHGPSVLAFAVIVLLAGVLIERRVLSPRPAQAGVLDAIPVLSTDPGAPGLRRIVLDPCTGLEKAQLSARTAKAD